MTTTRRRRVPDKAWWHAMSSNAVGSALGSGLVIAATALVGIALGIVRSPTELQHVAIWAIAIVLFAVALIGMLFFFREIDHYGASVILLAVIVEGILFTACYLTVRAALVT